MNANNFGQCYQAQKSLSNLCNLRKPRPRPCVYLYNTANTQETNQTNGIIVRIYPSIYSEIIAAVFNGYELTSIVIFYAVNSTTFKKKKQIENNHI